MKSIWLIGSAVWFRWASSTVILLYTGQMLHSKWWGLGLKNLSAGTKREIPLRLKVTWQTHTQRNKSMLDKHEKTLPKPSSHFSIWVAAPVLIFFLIEGKIFKRINSTWTCPWFQIAAPAWRKICRPTVQAQVCSYQFSVSLYFAFLSSLLPGTFTWNSIFAFKSSSVPAAYPPTWSHNPPFVTT